MRVVPVCLLSLAVAGATGCGKIGGIESKGAVQSAIEAHLKQRPNILLANMTLEVQDVKFRGDRADAEVIYHSKESPELAVRVRYVLRRAGDHWEVESNSPAGGGGSTPHSSAGPTSPPSSEVTAPQSSH